MKFRYNAETLASAKQPRVATLCHVVAAIVEQWSPINPALHGVKAVAHLLKFKSFSMLTKARVAQDNCSAHQILKHNLLIHRAQLEVHSVIEHLLVYLRL